MFIPGPLFFQLPEISSINPSFFSLFLCLIFYILKNNMEEFFNENDSYLHITFTDIQYFRLQAH